MALHAFALLALVGHVGALKASSRRYVSPSGRKYFFSVRHRVGTVLTNGICDDLSHTLAGSDCRPCTAVINMTADEFWCEAHFYDSLTKQHTISMQRHDRSTLPFIKGFRINLDNMSETKSMPDKWGFVNYRGVFLIRDPLSMLVSQYVYELKNPNDRASFWLPPLSEWPEVAVDDRLRKLAALAVQRDELVDGVANGMLRDHTLAESDPKLLELRFEDFKTDFNTSVRKVFDFLVGDEHGVAEREVFLNTVQRRNMRRWTPQRLAADKHVSHAGDARQIAASVDRLCRSGDPAIVELASYRQKLGYAGPAGDPCYLSVEAQYA